MTSMYDRRLPEKRRAESAVFTRLLYSRPDERGKIIIISPVLCRVPNLFYSRVVVVFSSDTRFY